MKHSFKSALAAAALSMFASAAMAQTSTVSVMPVFEVDSVNAISAPIDKEARHEVVELYMYSCPHCHALDPLVEQWQSTLPEDVNFELIPVIFSDKEEDYLRLHYGLKRMGADMNAVKHALFKTIHIDKRMLRKRDEFTALGAKLTGFDPVEIDKMMSSFSVSGDVKKSMKYFVNSGARGVPTFVVDGKHRVDPSKAKSHGELVSTLDSLIVE